MKKIIYIVIAVIGYFSANAQVMPEYSLYNQNLLLYNPAVVGINGGITANVGHKIQWIGVKEAPQNTYVSVDGLLTNSMGLGIVAGRQSAGLLDISNISLNYSYRVGITANQSIAFGLNMNFLQNKVSTSGLNETEMFDPALNSNKFDASILTSGFGISYRVQNFSLDVSSPILFSYQEDKIMQQVFSFAAYDFYLSNNIWRLQPSVLAVYTSNMPAYADINLLADWNSNIWMQASYSTNKNVAFAVGVFIKYIGIAYAYDLSLKPLSTFSSSTHEIMIQISTPYSLSKKKPLYLDKKNRNTF